MCVLFETSSKKSKKTHPQDKVKLSRSFFEKKTILEHKLTDLG